MDPGKQYLIVSTFGWGLVGKFVKMTNFNDADFEEAHFVTKCGDETDWGRFVRNGPGRNPVVNLLGKITVNLDHRIFSAEFPYVMPKSR